MLSKVYSKKNRLPRGKDGMIGIVKDGPGYVLYMFIEKKWWKIGNALDPIANGEGKVLSRGGKPPKGVFSTIELTSPPKGKREIGLLSSKSAFTSKSGGFGDTHFTIGGFSRNVVATAGWMFINGDAMYNTGSTATTTGSTVALSHSASIASHYKFSSSLYSASIWNIICLWG